jgi:hypothetical protein
MPTLVEVFHQLCTDGRIPQTRRKNFLSTIRAMAASHQTTPDRLHLTPEIETTYKARLGDYLQAQGKSAVSIRNAMQEMGQLIRLAHDLPKATAIPQQPATLPTYGEGEQAMNAVSPYRHQSWLGRSPYRLPYRDWPIALKTAYGTFERLTTHLRPATIKRHLNAIEALAGYLSLSPAQRLDRLPTKARTKLETPRYAKDLQEICAAPQTMAWDDFWVVEHVSSFVTWNAWRIHADSEASVQERAPSKPSSKGRVVAEVAVSVAKTLKRTKAVKRLVPYFRGLKPPRKTHDKRAEYHRFSFDELERVALALMDEARRMRFHDRQKTGPWAVEYPGKYAAIRFQRGLILMMGWRTPMRARNWCEALLDTNLQRVNGGYRWYFEGDELKIGVRNGQTNVYRQEIAPEVIPYLEEYLQVWRPKLPLTLPDGGEDRHVFPSVNGRMLNTHDLSVKLKYHVFRHTGKRFYPHLLRSIFTSNAIHAGMDVNSAAFVLGDTPKVVWASYNEVYGDEEHQQSLHAFYRRVLASGNGTSR